MQLQLAAARAPNRDKAIPPGHAGARHLLLQLLLLLLLLRRLRLLLCRLRVLLWRQQCP
jgi:hypothetical protein